MSEYQKAREAIKVVLHKCMELEDCYDCVDGDCSSGLDCVAYCILSLPSIAVLADEQPSCEMELASCGPVPRYHDTAFAYKAGWRKVVPKE